MRIPDFVALEMRMAELMAQQEASGFRFDMDAAERVKEELACEAKNLEEKIAAIYNYYPGKVFTPKRTSAKTGYVAGAPMTKLIDFNPTSRTGTITHFADQHASLANIPRELFDVLDARFPQTRWWIPDQTNTTTPQRTSPVPAAI